LTTSSCTGSRTPSSWWSPTPPTPRWWPPPCASARPGYPAQVDDKTSDYALIAIQGPHASRILQSLTDTGLDQVRYYTGQPAVVAGREVLLARTGYTGEDGFELFTSPADAEPVWMALSGAGEADGLVPAGLAARDTLRLEAGMPLYGNELGPDDPVRRRSGAGGGVRQAR
jgi:Glycine cleavage system T protein (aminomethyltransferase)